MISVEMIEAAQAGDLDAVTSIVTYMDRHISGIARRAASRKGRDFDRYADEFRSTANIALWKMINDYDGDGSDFEARAYRAMDYRVAEEARGSGDESDADRRMMSAFAAAVERADGDVYLAERLARTHAYTKRGRLSADAAHAARLRWQGCESLDRTVNEAEGGTETVGSRIADESQSVEDLADVEASPVSPNAVRRALDALRPYMGTPADPADRDALRVSVEMLAAGVSSVITVETVSENIRVPRNRADRMVVLTAIGILSRASEDPASLTTTPDDEYAPPAEDNAEQRESAARAQTVRAILGRMVDTYRLILTYTYGIGGVEAYGRGTACHDTEGLSADSGVPLHRINDVQDKAHASFGKRWIKAMSISTSHAETLTQAMRERNRKRKAAA